MPNRFDQKLAQHGLELKRGRLETLQVNVGRKCNQACRHCHVDAAPWRTEMIDEPTARRIGDWITKHRPEVVDITGGAPEISEHFRYFVETSRAAGAKVIDRNNLTIIEEPGYEDLPEYLARQEVEIIASLPCYSKENVNRQRGNGVFDKSIAALQKLNAVGYGDTRDLHLVYNPLGPKLPGPQGGTRGRLQGRPRTRIWHRIQPALHDHQSAHRALCRRSAQAGEMGRLSRDAGQRVQPRDHRRPHVPRNTQRRLLRGAL